jgi:hypothetical protein
MAVTQCSRLAATQLRTICLMLATVVALGTLGCVFTKLVAATPLGHLSPRAGSCRSAA